MGRERIKLQRNRLFAQQNGKCHWCGCAMMHWNDFKNDPGKRSKVLPKNLATLDHLRDRYDPKRQLQANGEKRWVIACFKCNNDRGKRSEAAQPIEILWEASKSHPSRRETIS